MTVDARLRARRTGRSVGAYGGLLARVQAELGALRIDEDRRCALCGRPIRGGQDLERVLGTAVHVHCSRARSAGGAPS